jgi:hypothetical protein
VEFCIDLDVSFKLPGGRKATVDAEALALFVASIWEAGELKNDPEDGKEKRFIDLGDALKRLETWIKAVKGNEALALSHGELLAIWKVANAPDGQDSWSQKKRSWDAPVGKTPGLNGSTAVNPCYLP